MTVVADAGLQGVEAPLVPSYQHQGRRLDPAAIEDNARLLARQGFSQVLCQADGRLSLDEVQVLVAAAVRGCQGASTVVGVQCSRASSQEQVATLRGAGAEGAAYAVVDVPLTVDASSEQEVVSHLVRAAACGLPVLLDAPGQLDLSSSHPSGLPFSVLRTLADQRGIAGLRWSANDLATLTQLHAEFGERYLIVSTSFFAVPMLFDLLGARWLCGCVSQALHAPTRPYTIELYQLLRAGNFDAAMTMYWRLVPIYRVVDRNLRQVSGIYENYIGLCQAMAGGARSVARDPAARVKRAQELELTAVRGESDLEFH